MASNTTLSRMGRPRILEAVRSTCRVRAHDDIVKSPDFAAFVNSGDLQKPVSLSARDIFGPHFQSRLKGYDLSGSQTVFGPDTKILAIFRNDGGVVKLVMMYPEP